MIKGRSMYCDQQNTIVLKQTITQKKNLNITRLENTLIHIKLKTKVTNKSNYQKEHTKWK